MEMEQNTQQSYNSQLASEMSKMGQNNGGQWYFHMMSFGMVAGVQSFNASSRVLGIMNHMRAGCPQFGRGLGMMNENKSHMKWLHATLEKIKEMMDVSWLNEGKDMPPAVSQNAVAEGEKLFASGVTGGDSMDSGAFVAPARTPQLDLDRGRE